MVNGIEHTAIASTDPERLAHWYANVLGFHINFRPPNSRTVFVKAPDGSMIEIIEAAHASSAAFQMNDPGLRHLALTVDDFEAACHALTAKGVRFLADPQTHNGNSLVFFADPDGNILHLLHRQAPLP